MTKVQIITQLAQQVTNNENVIQALVAYFLELSWNAGDYAAATTEAAYELETTNIDEFKKALKLMIQIV
jgi:hypothetical protein